MGAVMMGGPSGGDNTALRHALSVYLFELGKAGPQAGRQR